MSTDISLEGELGVVQDALLDKESIDDESDDSEIDKAEFGLYQCLPVDDGTPNFETDEPLTVEEYLRRVRYEASMLPNVKRSAVPIKSKKMPALKQGVFGSDLAQCGAERKPSVVWIRSFLSQFVSLRNVLENLRLNGQSAWQCGIFESDLPGIETLLPLGQVELQDLLESKVNKLREGDGIDKESFIFLYILSALIEIPCHPDVLATMRNLARYCADIRAKDPCPGMEELSIMNLLITICGGLFKQDEELATMWDEEMFSLP